ncbi:alpha/beta hydrolase [Acaryochloris sp. CCMEE 5410]|uniref:alpha/beta hydrolase n=1 Tax=Acaryochloris sp. CCMEE 5410 TaxID=310037 RepID=UPI00024848BE|nr:alpha/beta hydrolase [Acaryochloris sp. CCMEE 5410]KAI9132264.1 alpha/beta hydrolase [Acaryochloris sp. CCMEE 5410]
MATWYSLFQQIRRWQIGLTFSAIASISVAGLMPTPVRAAEKVVFTYNQFGQSLTVDELETFAQTGQASSNLKFFLRVSGQDPETARQFMTKDLKVDLRTADKILHLLPGEYALFQAGQVIHTPEKKANLQALRSAILLSLSDDNQISFLEFLQRYPTQQLYVDGARLADVAGTIDSLMGSAEDVAARTGPLAAAKDVLSSFICDCQPRTATTP